jgi:hypothetical protein
MKVRKPGQLTDTEKANLKIEIRAGCRNMGVNSMYSSVAHRVRIYNRKSFGLCHNCGHFGFASTQYKIRYAVCERYEGMLMGLTESEPIIECSGYYQKGEQDAHDYSKNAWLIDTDEPKVGII